MAPAGICIVTPMGHWVRSGDLRDGSIKRKRKRVEGRYGTHAELLLAFWASIGFKPGDFMTIGMNEKRAAWLCRVLNRVTPPCSSCALDCSEPPQRNPSWPR